MIKFSHTLFALPFALSGAALAAARNGVTAAQIGWIIAAMVGARSAAMGFNRLADREMDAQNPRTANREIPRGVITPASVVILVALSSGLLVFAAHQLNPLCFALSPVALGMVFFYSYTKRFTWGTQFFLGLSLSVAPIGAWIAVTGTLDPEILPLGGAVLAWVAGFDTIYACQDVAFDRAHGIYSLPQRFGIRRALLGARALHVLALLLLAQTGRLFELGPIYVVGVLLVAGLLVYEHRLLRGDDLSRLSVAVFKTNGVIGCVYFAFTLGDIVWIT
jgi:4-hydroxybenzoate polyprenyltransferase